ncbi:hypothetical protein BDK51DRAFT_49540 [Blyttiomyces helicus]|uniref:Uncharacterized protein n=1 Tax=Blyttiomyces helicus TaxID=388810 RepID=A0A4P9VXG4_9FUNG|nr:hypothetical protein BDK51DRAFT_49540 [Blyttiomyces helicus]|eukprot:RKO83942.1 hypothetical protein BDK51DRAFT_49540 [Blyttiomyces helicus]
MSRYIDTQFIDQLPVNAIPTPDLGTPPASGHVFRVKVYSEHTWVIDAGRFWYYCGHNRMLVVTGYVMKGSLGVYKRKPAVMRLLLSSDDVDQTLIWRVSSFSFTVRAASYNYAVSSATGKLIVDVGSSRIQSFSIFRKHATSYVLCDPNFKLHPSEDPCAWEGVTDLPESQDGEVAMINILRKMKSGKVCRAYAHRPVGELFQSSRMLGYLAEKHVPLVYAYSLSHVPVEFDTYRRRGLQQFAAGYMYDDAGSDGVLVNSKESG